MLTIFLSRLLLLVLDLTLLDLPLSLLLNYRLAHSLLSLSNALFRTLFFQSSPTSNDLLVPPPFTDCPEIPGVLLNIQSLCSLQTYILLVNPCRVVPGSFVSDPLPPF
jgi:hypothetical protein